MAYVRRRGARWYVGFRDERGLRTQRAVTARTKTEALALARELERKAERVRLGLDVAPTRMTVAELVDVYLPVARARRAGTKGGTHSYAVLESRLRRHVVRALGPKLLHEVRPGDVDALLAQKAAAGLSPQTLRHIQNHVAALYRYATEQLRVYSGPNPGRLSMRVSVPERLPRFLEAPAVPALLAAVPDQWRGLFAVALYTGLRKGELFALRVADVDLGRGVLFVQGSYDGSTKSGRPRAVPVPDELRPYLERELGRARSPYLFPRADGGQHTPDTKLTDTTRRALRKAGLVEGFDHICRRKTCRNVERRADDAPGPCPRCGFKLHVRPVPLAFSFKDLRSTFATHVYEATGDIRATQRLLGHSDPRLTDRAYARARDSRLQELAGRLTYGALPAASRLPATKSKAAQQDATAAKVVALKRRGKTK